MSMNKGLKVFGMAGTNAVHKEMKQLHDRKVSIPVDLSRLSRGDKSHQDPYHHLSDGSGGRDLTPMYQVVG